MTRREALFDEVLAEYRSRLGRIALIYGGREADDLLQEILLQVWRSLPGFEDRSSIRTWCHRIAINTAISWKRKTERTRVERSTSELDHLPASLSHVQENETSLLKQFLATLSDVDQAVLLMHLNNLSQSEIANVLGVTDGAVRMRMSRLRQKLSGWDHASEPNAKQRIPEKEVADG